MASINGKTTTPTPTNHDNQSPKAEIQAVQSVSPTSVTTPRTVRKISTREITSMSSFGSASLHVVLYYNNNDSNNNNNSNSTSDGDVADLGSVHAGWIKESLAGALMGQPLLAGRLQRDDDGGLSLVSNDAGARLVEAFIGVQLSEFIILAGHNNNKLESELVYWKDIEETTDPQFSPLFYVQVTKFKCGGYSFGISCSILLADFLLKGDFFKKWAELHNNLLQKNGVIEKPLFYLPDLKKDPTSTISNIFSNTASKDSGQTVLFNIDQSMDYSSQEFSSIAMLCVQEAEKKIERNLATQFIFVMFPSDLENFVKVEKFFRHEIVAKPGLAIEKIGRSSWENFGGNELQFLKGNRPIYVSHWIGSVSSEVVIGIPCCNEKKGPKRLEVIVKLPNHSG